MTLPLSREMLSAMYDYLRATPPFSRWKLPESGDVVFCVVRDPARLGFYRRDRLGRPEIGISTRGIGHTNNLANTMAHEMIHLYEDAVLGTLYKTKAEHSATFRRKAAQVCKYHGFDPKLFY